MKDGLVQIIAGSESTDRWLVTTAIGGNYFNRWFDAVRPYWMAYAERHELGVAVAVRDLPNSDEPLLNGSWQKLLAPRALRGMLGRDVRVALIDTDVLMTAQARCIFDHAPSGKIGVISQRRGLPLPVDQLRRRVALYRRVFLDPTFPLTSILNAPPHQVFDWAGLPTFNDYFCAGVLVLDTESHAELFAEWYRNAPQHDRYLELGAWEQDWLNVCIQGHPDAVWLEYSWQALWMYEVAALYPFLYAPSCSPEIAAWCLAASLIRNDFVHMAGSWESGLLHGLGPSFPDVGDLRALIEEVRQADECHDPAVMRGKILPPNAE